MQMTKNAIKWFAIPALDFNRAKQFYSATFDFSMPEMSMAPNTMAPTGHRFCVVQARQDLSVAPGVQVWA